MRDFLLVLVALGLLGCGGSPTVDNGTNSGERDSGSNEPDDTPDDDTATDDDADDTEDDDSPIIDDDADDDTDDSDAGPNVPVDPCVLENCSAATHCEPTDGGTVCVPNQCSDLDCSETERCVETSEGAVCRDLTCATDVECEAGEFCDDESGLCAPTVCEPNQRRCEANTFIACDTRGSGESVRFDCAADSTYFESVCIDGSGCSCEDDWDCPPFTICELGVCEGTGLEPTCSLPPVAFSAEDTQVEISWGGINEDDQEAEGSPYPDFAQVLITPVVANLDDDNEDGIIDEQDIPEIVFVSSAPGGGGAGLNFNGDGVLRAIHGGPTVRTVDGEQMTVKSRGGNYLAVCSPEEDRRWLEGEGFADGSEGCDDEDPVLNPSGGVAVGDLDYDGVPEIVVSGELTGSDLMEVYLFTNRGEFLAKSPSFNVGASAERPISSLGGNAAPAIANIDADGNAEIVVGRWVFTVERPAESDPVDGDAGAAPPSSGLRFGPYFQGLNENGANGQGPVSCVANVIDDGTAVQEIVAGSSVYRMPVPDATETDQDACSGTPWCDRELETIWDALEVNVDDEGESLLPLDEGDPVVNGFCAIADVLGADTDAAPGPDNPLDGVAEVIVQSNAHLFIFNGQTGLLLRDLSNVEANTEEGGPPNVDDFDGDGFPEIGTAAQFGYAVYDLQAPGEECPEWPDFASRGSGRTPPDMSCQAHEECGDTTQFGCNLAARRCVCLHNGWSQQTQDASSRVTGSSVFDFNGDGAAEVVYNDECRFRVYDGLSGDVLIEEWSESITRIEYPVVADVDRDGNAEIVFAANNASSFCTNNFQGSGDDPPRELFNNGIEVWGDQRDLWVPARGIWNQHAYHVTNVTESGEVPLAEPESWKILNGRRYNTYRSNPRNFGVAPDLIVQGIQVSSPDAACGQLGTQLVIVVDVANQGDLLVGTEILVGVYGSWDGEDFEALLDDNGDPLRLPLGSALLPRRNLILTFPTYSPSNNGQNRLPSQLRVVIDDTELETECIEDNNERIADVTDGDDLPDLSISLGEATSGCPLVGLTAAITNSGSAPASNIEIAFYQGDPAQGGSLLTTIVFDGPLEPGTTEQFEVEIPLDRSATIYATVDPNRTIEECNDGNNSAQGPSITCAPPRNRAR